MTQLPTTVFARLYNMIKGKGVYRFLRETHHRATERHLPYRWALPATQQSTQVNVPRLKPSQAGQYLIYLPGGMEG